MRATCPEAANLYKDYKQRLKLFSNENKIYLLEKIYRAYVLDLHDLWKKGVITSRVASRYLHDGRAYLNKVKDKLDSQLYKGLKYRYYPETDNIADRVKYMLHREDMEFVELFDDKTDDIILDITITPKIYTIFRKICEIEQEEMDI